MIDVQWERSLKHLDLNLSTRQVQHDVGTWDTYLELERGNLEPDAFYREFCRRFNLEVDFEHFKNGWNACLAGPLDGVEDIFARLSRELPLYALSNTNVMHTDHYLQWPLFQRFTKVLTSQDLRTRKPEPKIYQMALETMAREQNVLPSQVLFVDDLPENLEAAKKAGMHAERSVYNSQELENILRRYGIL